MAKRKPPIIPEIINQAYDYVLTGTPIIHPRNVRQGDVSVIVESIRHNGFYGALVVDRKTKYVCVGNHRLMAARELQLPTVPVIWIDADEEQQLRLLVADNRTSDIATNNDAALAALLGELQQTADGLAGTGFDQAALDTLLGELGQASGGESGLLPDVDPDEMPEDVAARVNLGEIWALGDHRLMCGSATDADHIMRLMDGQVAAFVFADPPYGVTIVSASSGYISKASTYQAKHGITMLEAQQRKKGTVGGGGPMGGVKANPNGKVIPPTKYAPIIGDDTIDTAVDSVNVALGLFPDAAQFWWGGNYYAHAVPPSSCWIVWDKQNTGNFADAELAWTNQKTATRIFVHQWSGLIKASERGEKRVHPTQKPVALAVWCYEKYGKIGDIVFDPFCGSGMSIIAGESCGRIVYATELSPDYCDVIIARWEKATGKTATLIEGA